MSKCKNYMTLDKFSKKKPLKLTVVWSKYLHVQTSNLCVLIDLNNRCNHESNRALESSWRLEFCPVKQGSDQIKLPRYKVLTHTTTVSSSSRHLITTSIYSTPSLVEVLKLRA